MNQTTTNKRRQRLELEREDRTTIERLINEGRIDDASMYVRFRSAIYSMKGINRELGMCVVFLIFLGIVTAMYVACFLNGLFGWWPA